MKEKREFRLHNGTSGSAVTVRVVPKSSRNELSEILNDGTIKIRLTTSASEEATNRALIGFLAEILEVEAARVEIVAGVTGKDKLVTVTDMDAEAVQQKILQKLA
jgi:uncharacterized protein YggU (UPF0235/DUF167 family)